MKQETKGMLFGFLGVMVFGITLPATRIVVIYLDPIFIGLGRASLAAIFAGVLLLVTRQPQPNKQQWLKLFITGLGVVIAFPIFSAWGMQTVPASHGGVVLGILPLGTSVAAALIYKEYPSLGFWVCGVTGSLLVVVYSLMNGGLGDLFIGDLALLLAVIGTSISYATGGSLSRDLGGWQVICWALVVMFPFIIGPALWQASLQPLSQVPFEAWGAFFYLAFMSQLFGFFLWNKGLALGGIARVSQVQLLQPFVTILIAFFLLGETVTLSTLLFAGLVVLIVGLGKRMPVSKRRG